MARHRGTGYVRDVPQAERIEWVRRQIVEGMPDWEIRRKLVAGVMLLDEHGKPTGRKFQVNRHTASKYLDKIGLEYQALSDHPLVIERVIGAVAERLARIAHKAEAQGNYQAAVRANLALVDVVARRSPDRWGRGSGDAPAELNAPPAGDGYDTLDDDALNDLVSKRVLSFAARKAARSGAA